MASRSNVMVDHETEDIEVPEGLEVCSAQEVRSVVVQHMNKSMEEGAEAIQTQLDIVEKALRPKRIMHCSSWSTFVKRLERRGRLGLIMLKRLWTRWTRFMKVGKVILLLSLQRVISMSSSSLDLPRTADDAYSTSSLLLSLSIIASKPSPMPCRTSSVRRSVSEIVLDGVEVWAQVG